MMEIQSDLVVQLDEEGRRFIFSLRKNTGRYSPETEAFTIEMPSDVLKARGSNGAEKLIGESVLGVFDRLTSGRLDLSRHYTD